MNATESARALGRLGGQARARRLSTERKKEIASRGGHARAMSLQAARRVSQNLSYAKAARELAGGPRKVTRVKTFTGRLPGVYA